LAFPLRESRKLQVSRQHTSSRPCLPFLSLIRCQRSQIVWKSNSTTGEEQQFEEIFGLLAKFSDYKVGDVITYRSSDTGRIKRGEIMWVELPGRTVSGKEHPLTYWVGFDAMYPSDILEDDDEGTNLY
jgi:hypothetical protein